MSLDKSLKSRDALQRHRNVLTRAERVEAMKDNGSWSDDSSPLHLPKMTHRKAAVGKKDKAAKKTEGSEDDKADSET